MRHAYVYMASSVASHSCTFGTFGIKWKRFQNTIIFLIKFLFPSCILIEVWLHKRKFNLCKNHLSATSFPCCFYL